MFQNFGFSILKNRLFIYGLVMAAIAIGWSNQVGRFVARVAAQEKKAIDEAGPSADPLPAVANDPNAPPTAAPPAKDPGMSIIKLAADGGFFMWPLYALSILTVAVIVERIIGLRKDKIIPQPLITALGQLGQSKGGFDPRKAYRICQENPCPTSNVIRGMLLKVGRPHSEVEHTVKEASDREANRMFSNVRWLNLSAAIAPLIGLLGTVQGMILAFHKMTTLDAHANKATELADGIYTALVTTFAGLCIAIPAATASHFFEGQITAMFHDIDELLFNLLPQIERFEGRVRFSRQAGEGAEFATEATDEPAAPPAPPVQPRAATVPK